MTVIPKIIHQTWKTTNIPPEWQGFAQSWRDHHPDWEYRLWTDADGRDFVATHVPAFLPIYDAYQHNIERADVIRYLVLQQIGGVYADLDVECLAAVDPLLIERTCLFSTQHKIHAQRQNEPLLICNSWMASVPHHPFWLAVLQELQRCDPRLVAEMLVVYRTGPNMLVRVWQNYTGQDVHILASQVFSPLAVGMPLHQHFVQNRQLPAATKAKLKAEGSYGIHYFDNSWTTATGSLINPNPTAIEGFTFHPGLRLVDWLEEREGRDMPALAELARHDPSIMAFDTDGVITRQVRNALHPHRRIAAAANEGLYVRHSLKHSLRTQWSIWRRCWRAFKKLLAASLL